VERHGLGQISDTAELEAVVARVVADNPAQAEQFRAGKQQVLGFFVGQVMKASGGRANPQVVNDLVRKALAG
jgi:aspartyl-tRNA(Asn)/glutamyl-tRNA(Gln) amidotransferase subunit B